MANPPMHAAVERLQGADIEERPGLPHDEHEPDRDDDRQQHEQQHTDPRSGGPQRDEGACEGDGEGDQDAHRHGHDGSVAECRGQSDAGERTRAGGGDIRPRQRS